MANSSASWSMHWLRRLGVGLKSRPPRCSRCRVCGGVGGRVGGGGAEGGDLGQGRGSQRGCRPGRPGRRLTDSVIRLRFGMAARCSAPPGEEGLQSGHRPARRPPARRRGDISAARSRPLDQGDRQIVRGAATPRPPPAEAPLEVRRRTASHRGPGAPRCTPRARPIAPVQRTLLVATLRSLRSRVQRCRGVPVWSMQRPMWVSAGGRAPAGVVWRAAAASREAMWERRQGAQGGGKGRPLVPQRPPSPLAGGGITHQHSLSPAARPAAPPPPWPAPSC